MSKIERETTRYNNDYSGRGIESCIMSISTNDKSFTTVYCDRKVTQLIAFFFSLHRHATSEFLENFRQFKAH